MLTTYAPVVSGGTVRAGVVVRLLTVSTGMHS